MSGKSLGVLTCGSGDVYEGDFNGRFIPNMEGVGKMVFKNGTQYLGDFKNNFFEGEGQYTFADGKIYQG